MGEEVFEETILSSVHGWICLRGGYGRRHIYLGVSRRPYQDGDDPDVTIMLPVSVMERLRDRLTEALEDVGDQTPCSCCGDPAVAHAGFGKDLRQCTLCECEQYEAPS